MRKRILFGLLVISVTVIVAWFAVAPMRERQMLPTATHSVLKLLVDTQSDRQAATLSRQDPSVSRINPKDSGEAAVASRLSGSVSIPVRPVSNAEGSAVATSQVESTQPPAGSATESRQVPSDWGQSPNDSHNNDLASDNTFVWEGEASASLVAHSPISPNSLSTIEQVSQAAGIRGHRIRYSAHVKTKGAAAPGGGAIWFRAENERGVVLAFQATLGRLIGDNDWREQSIVIDIPTEATVALYGAFLLGPGTLWLDDVHIDLVELSVPLTAEPYPIGATINRRPDPSGILASPSNLNFEATTPVK